MYFVYKYVRMYVSYVCILYIYVRTYVCIVYVYFVCLYVCMNACSYISHFCSDRPNVCRLFINVAILCVLLFCAVSIAKTMVVELVMFGQINAMRVGTVVITRWQKWYTKNVGSNMREGTVGSPSDRRQDVDRLRCPVRG